MANIAIFILLCILTYSVYGYERDDPIPLYYNKIFSLKTKLAYSYPSLDFTCPSAHSSTKKGWLFDEDLRGDRFTKSEYKINFLENQECKLLCKKPINVENAIQIQELVEDDYLIEWELGDMPGVTVSYSNEAPEHNYKVGFPLGFKKGESTYINNHVIFQILYTPKKNEFGKYDIIGFEVYPDSIAEGECTKKNVDYEYQEITNRRTQISFTYSVQWKEVKNSDKKLWDAFLFKPNKERHERAVINGLIVVALISSAVFYILYKTKDTIHDDKDFKMYEDSDDFIGWKLISKDVFRRPLYGGLFAPVLGGGIQIVIATVSSIIALYLGWYHPAQPGAFTRWFTVFFMLASLVGGYCSARIYKVFRGKSWVLNSILTALVVPSVYIVIVFIYSLIAWSQQSSLAISFSGWISIVCICLFELVPLTCLGAYFGEKVDRIEYPTRTTQIPRMIPKKHWYQSPVLTVLASGIVPFSLAFLDWNEYLTSITRGESTLSIEYLVYISVLYLVCTAGITIIFIFLHLCSEDYNWWWQSFIIGGSSSLYMFAYSIFFLFKNTEVQGLIGSFIYTVNLFIGCSLIGLCTGTLGFISSYFFIRKIYSNTKKD